MAKSRKSEKKKEAAQKKYEKQYAIQRMFSGNVKTNEFAKTLDEIAGEMGICKERVRQLYARALYKMSKFVHEQAERRGVTPQEWMLGQYAGFETERFKPVRQDGYQRYQKRR